MQPIEVNTLGPSPKAENDGGRQVETKSTIVNYECGLLGSNEKCRVMKQVAWLKNINRNSKLDSVHSFTSKESREQ